MNRLFFLPDFSAYVLLEATMLPALYSHAQRSFRSKEAGGELFSSAPNVPGLVVRASAGPNPTDRRSRHHFNPDPNATSKNRLTHYDRGLHAVGLWHTHPQTLPRPSNLDRDTTLKYLKAFEGERSRYLMVIVGNSGDPPDIVVWSVESPSNRWIEWQEISRRSASLRR